MRILFFVQRFLATLIDLIIVYLPVLLLVQLIFTYKEVGGIGNFLAAILFVLYNLISKVAFREKQLENFLLN